MYAVIKLTIYEIIKRKIFIYSLIMYFLLYALLVVIILNNNSLIINNYFHLFLYFISSLIMVITSTDLIKKNIDDGTIEIFLTKPVGRKEFFIYKYISVLIINPIPTIFFFIGMILLQFVLASEINVCFIKVFFASFFIYIVFYSMIFFINIVSINYNLSFLVFIICILINVIYNISDRLIFLDLFINNSLFFYIAYFLVPRYVECSYVFKNNITNSLTFLNHSFYFIIFFLSLSIITLHKKDY